LELGDEMRVERDAKTAKAKERMKEKETDLMDVDDEDDIIQHHDEKRPEKDDDENDVEEYTQEAAVALVNVACLSGDVRQARHLTERYLVI